MRVAQGMYCVDIQYAICKHCAVFDLMIDPPLADQKRDKRYDLAFFAINGTHRHK